ncbi:hypothetical protein Glove_196g70 [Diversispora epigaea]|uniref:Uncharacterized protein n=1 Tax=Diversispora epigaea TaxID=1348612 RepID=A0A397ITY4_9GLOM|nr:hypothetical protein Glove_196g70 [Diversispora epigaea]
MSNKTHKCLLYAFIVLIKKRLGFNRHSIGSKRLSIDAFPETVFVHLFQYEPTFKYSPTQQKYSCQFKGNEGEERLKQILNYEYRSFRQDPITKTKVDSGEFVDENKPKSNKKNMSQNYRYILPRAPLQQLYINHVSINK